jgi:4-amino-4-deoxy-L-arabinose transferase-like glycosyltransferase
MLQALVAMVIVGSGYRMQGFHSMWINPDEGIYYAVAHASSFQEGWNIVSANPHPPLFYGLLGLFALFGDDPAWLRLPALIAGCALIPVMFLFAREVGGEVCAIVAAGLVTLSPGAIGVSQVARPYSLQALVLCLTLWCLSICLRRGETKWLLLLAVLSCLSLLVHYSSLQVLAGAAAVSVGIAWRQSDRPHWVRLGLAHVPWVLCFGLLYWTHVQPRLLGTDGQRQAVDGWLADGYIASSWDLFEVWRGIFEYLAGAAPMWLWFLGLGLGTWASMKRLRYLKRNPIDTESGAPRDLLMLGLVVVVVPLATLLSILQLYPLGTTRHSGYLLVVFAPMIGLGVARLVEGEIRLPMAASVLTLVVAVLAGVTPSVLGLHAPRRHPHPELTITRAEIEEAFLPEIRKLLDTQGIVLMDQETAHTLVPVLQAEAGFLYRGGVPRADLTWGERRIHIAPACWIMMPGGEGPRDLVCSLRDALSGVDSDVRDLHLVATNWGRVGNAYAPLIASSERGRGPLYEVTQADCCAIFRLDASRIR